MNSGINSYSLFGMTDHNAVLLLEDGALYSGVVFGAQPRSLQDFITHPGDMKDETGIGEVVFNTGMTGYYEILTDPSYTGQMVVMTYPHIGNYGIDPVWSETAVEKGTERQGVKPSALIVKKLYRGAVPPGRQKLDDLLKENGVTGIEEIDTRKLTLRIRDGGSPRGVILRTGSADIGDAELKKAVQVLQSFPPMEGRNLLSFVGTTEKYSSPAENAAGAAASKIAVIDYGIKANILRELKGRGFSADVFPSSLSDPNDIINGGYLGVMLSNGPGDPASLAPQVEVIRKLIGALPVCGICLGHQLISLALGAATYKMKFGHHGLNHPVKDRKSGRVFVTSQNHGFSVDPDSLPSEVSARFINANDHTVEGLAHRDLPVLSVQFHPEACPGPFDSLSIFDEFAALMAAGS